MAYRYDLEGGITYFHFSKAERAQAVERSIEAQMIFLLAIGGNISDFVITVKNFDEAERIEKVLREVGVTLIK